MAVAVVASSWVHASPNYGEVLQKSIYFYEAQQSGPLPDWNRVEWRGDSGLDDGSDVGYDLTGGWYDAGDHVKFGLPMAASATMLALSVVEYPEAYEGTGQLEHIKNNLSFVADYFVKAHSDTNELYGQVGNGGYDHAWWGSAEVMTMDRPAYKIDADNPGSDLAGETAAALAAISMVFADDDPDYAAELLSHAKELYAFADNYRGVYSDAITDAASYYNSWSGYNDEIVWGAIWLYRATGDETYLEKAIAEYDNLGTSGQGSTVKAYAWTQAWDDKSYGSYLLLAKATRGTDYYDAKYEDDTERWLDYWTDGYNGAQVNYTSGGLAYLDVWGAARYSANTAFMALVYADYLDENSEEASKADTYYNFAVSQMEYLLGDNPKGISYQIGYSDYYPVKPHHRTAHGAWANSISSNPTDNRHILVGALVGGPDSNDDYEDDRSDYYLNEVTTDYNAGFTGAAARLWLDYGGEPIADSNFPEPEQRDDELYVEAKVNSTGDQYLEIASVTYNHTAWPARATDNLKFRYFMDLSEEFDLGYSADDITIESGYAQSSQTTISGPILWSGNIYYVEVNFDGVEITPISATDSKSEVQFRMRLPYSASGSWVYSTDPSWNSDFANGYTNATSFALYEGDELVWGEEPSVSCDAGSNCAPTANDVTAETGYATSVSINLSATDSDGSIAYYEVASSPVNGTVNISGSAATYIPDDNFYGEDSFTYTAIDNEGSVSAPATVSVTVAEPLVPSISISGLEDYDEVEASSYLAIAVSYENAEGANVYMDGALQETLSAEGTAYVTMPEEPTTVTILVIAIDENGYEVAAEDSVILTVVESEEETTDEDTSTGSDDSSTETSTNEDSSNSLAGGSLGWLTLFMLPVLIAGRNRKTK
ncbi:glycoside hydrolase family 9 protein [Reinekea marinisedimentorum]|nr:glycoside hydrolase family 9 protein [Reinekea marinisedimentorum]